MATQNHHAPDVLGGVAEVGVNGVVEVTGPLIGRNIIDGLWRKLSPRSQIQEGDYFMDRSRDLLRRHIQLIELREKGTISRSINELV
jgi:hypothetical protein